MGLFGRARRDNAVPVVHTDSSLDTAANAAVVALLRQQVAEGRQAGVAVAAFRHGRLIAHAWAGDGVRADTLFMAASVSKGCVAAALAVLHSRGLLDYAAPVSKYWAAFAARGKAEVTVEQAVSHRAGLCAGTPGPRVVARLLALHAAFGWRAMLDGGIAWVATLEPEWPPGTQAAYHHVSWSWIVAGIVRGCTGGAAVRDVFAEHVAAPLAAARDAHVGVLPRAEARRVCKMVRPGLVALWRHTREELLPHATRLVCLVRTLLAWLEALVMTLIFNSALFASVCLPSSNGFWTAAAVARLYGALANGGRVELPADDAGGDAKVATLLTDDALARIVAKVRDDPRVPSPREGPGSRALNGLGFTPWPGAVHGADTSSCILGHGGMGGSVAFADIDRGLGVAILRAGYTPISLSQTSACATTRELADCIRAHC